MFKKFRFSLSFILLASFLLSFQASANTNQEPKDKLLLTILKYVLTEGHYQPQEINDHFSERVFDGFLERLDPTKRYFLQSDIDEFSNYKLLIDDQIKNEDLTFFFLVYNRLEQRFEDSKPYYKELLENPFNFEDDEILNVDFENLSYAKNTQEIVNTWRLYLKFNTLSRLHDKLTIEKDKQIEDNTYIIKSLDYLENEARLATLTNMDETFDRIKELTYTDWFSTFINSITEEFDPNTSYFDPSDKKRFDISMAGKLEGIGARLQKKNDYTKVVELISGGPAWKQGELEVEDLILKVAQGNQKPLDIVGMRLDDAIEFIKGQKGTEVRLTVKKIDGTIKIIKIIRDIVEIEETFIKSSIVEKDGKNFGVINLPKFYIDFVEENYRNSATDMAQEIERLKSENIEGLVIDLRNNGGGSLQTAIEITGLFINKGPVVQVKYRDKAPDIKNDKDPSVIWDKPVVVLVNELSASASEIFAAAMQDYGRAVIIGAKQTYGKGTVQSVLDLNRYHNMDADVGALKMTIQKFYRINGGSTQQEGVHSDIMLPSRYTYMEIGERDIENSLKYDKIAPTPYTLWDNYQNFNETVNNSKKRIGSNDYFKLIDKNAKWLKENQDDATVELNLQKFSAEIEATIQESKQYDQLKNYTTNLTYNSPLYETQLLADNTDLAEKRKVWHSNLKKDMYVEEAINVLSELKIKPKYQLVKN
ncbi:MAG: carboxy terminal-processing peptidase [Lutibacter sp.]|nr:carboxy terminal-processing peptidase [Lutibacter sp.]MDP3313402.1 carboxy terminal-processing peptidase [Lutibacter sp.]